MAVRDENQAIYDKHYGQASFRLDGDTYSQAMHAIRFELIERFGRDRDVLDVGCATGEYLRPMVSLTRTAIGLDYTQRFLDEFAATYPDGLPKNLRLVRADAREMPLPDASIDFAFSYATLYTIEDTGRVVSELRRVVRPGGRIALEFGNLHSLNATVSAGWHKAEGWAKPFLASPKQISAWLREANFEEETRRVFQVLPLYAVPRRLLPLRLLSGVPLRPILGRRLKSGRMIDEVVCGLPGLNRLAFRQLIIAVRK